MNTNEFKKKTQLSCAPRAALCLGDFYFSDGTRAKPIISVASTDARLF